MTKVMAYFFSGTPRTTACCVIVDKPTADYDHKIFPVVFLSTRVVPNVPADGHGNQQMHNSRLITQQIFRNLHSSLEADRNETELWL